MRICIFGAGAIGGYVGGFLARGGAAVSVVARGAQLAAIRAGGLTVEVGGVREERFTVPVQASDDPAALGAQDAVIVAVKAPGIPAAARALAPLLRADTPVAFLTNGVPWWYFHGHGGALDGRRLEALDPGGAVWDAIGPERTVGGIAWPASSVPAPGVSRVLNPLARPTILGMPDGRVTPGLERLAAAFEAGGLKVAVDPAIRDRIWEKIAFNISAGPMCVLTETAVRDVWAEAAARDAGMAAVAEVLALAAALGRSPVVDQALIGRSNATLGHKPSILQDLLARRPMEVAALYDVPLLLGAWTGVAMPTLALLAALIRVKVGAPVSR